MPSAPLLSAAGAANYLFDDHAGEFSSELLRRSDAANRDELLRLGLAARLCVPSSDRFQLEVALACLADAPGVVLDRVAADPSAYHWVCIARMCVDDARGAARDPVLGQYEREFRLGPEAFRRRHLNDLRRFGLAAALLTTRDTTLAPAVENPFSWVLPGTGMVLVPSSGTSNLPALTRDALSRLAAGSCDGVASVGDAWQVVRQDGGELKLPFLIDSQDACMRLSFVEAFPRVDEPEGLACFGHVLAVALDHLRAFDAGLAGGLPGFVRRVCPMRPGSRAVMASGSVSSMFGAVFVSAVPEPLFAAEMLLHEFGHNKLRLLDDVYGLLDDDGDERAAYYSPWRQEPRPLDGLMHGLYVFSLVARFWAWVNTSQADTDRRLLAERRLRTLIKQLEFGLHEFEANARLTPSGAAYLVAVKHEIARLRSDKWSPHTPGLCAFLVGNVDPELVMLTPEEAVVRHRQTFHARFRDAAHA